jgi:adenylate kinase
VPRLIFLGAPGSGKGTQAQLLAQSFQIPHISTGDLLRQAVAEKTSLGQQAKAYMDRGELVPDQLVLQMIRDRLAYQDTYPGWILDGFPRNVSQAVFLDELLHSIGQDCSQVFNLDVPDEVLMDRLLGRGRQDDTESVIRRRLEVYREQTAPLIDFYQEGQKLVLINGNQPEAQVADALKASIQEQTCG